MIRALLLLLCSAALPLALSAQSDLNGVAANAATAWQGHSFGGFVRGERIQVTLPGVAPSTPVAADQAQALLQNYVRGDVEVEVKVAVASLVGTDAAYVELARRFRSPGSQEVWYETILLAYRRRPSPPSSAGQPPAEEGGWVLTEVRALGRG